MSDREKCARNGCDRNAGEDGWCYICGLQEKGKARCPFCQRIARGEYDERRLEVVRFEPLNPVTPGHMLFIPVEHARSAALDPMGAARAMKVAADYIRGLGDGVDANIITSIGEFATQSVQHTHIHVVPRTRGDGLHLPWTGQKRIDNEGAES